MEPRLRPFKQVDVFTDRPFFGNPVAVVLDASGLSTADMQQIAQWTNLSETTFVLPPEDPAASYKVRIFTPRAELPFAGHPTLGTAHAVAEAGIVAPEAGRLVQQCAVGLVEVEIGAARRSFRLPRYAAAPAPEPELLARALGQSPVAPPQILDVGPRWVILELASAADVRALVPDLALLADYDRRHGTTGLTLFAREGAGADLAVRSFAPADGIPEDPVCGSGNGAVAAYRLLAGQLADGDHYTASQGREVGRDGRIDIRITGTEVHVGGQCVTCLTGHIAL
ncbi:MAG: PhzF family phenazine biosynthesis protein [Chakrabartia sp.]